MKRIVLSVVLLCIFLIALVPAHAETEHVGRMMVTNCKKCVSLREAPTQDSERLAWVPYHTVVENCYSGYGDYCYVEYDGRPGYIHTDYLEVYYGYEVWEGESYAFMQIVDCPEWTPLREMADVNSAQLAQVPAGALVTNCVFYGDDYTYVEYNGLEGYVLTEYVTVGQDNSAETELGVKRVTNCNTKVSLRAAPTSESERLTWVPKGAFVVADDAEDGYYYVVYNDQRGYIFGDYLESYYGEEWYEDDSTEEIRRQLRDENASFGVYLVSGAMDGEWSLPEESGRLKLLLGGMPDQWQQIVKKIPESRMFEIPGGGELYLIVPTYRDMKVTVNQLQLGYDGFTGLVEKVLCRGEWGAPILVRCNAYDAVMDCEIVITDFAGNSVSWYPETHPESGRICAGAEGGTYRDYTLYDPE